MTFPYDPDDRVDANPPTASLARREAAAVVDALPFLLVAVLSRRSPDPARDIAGMLRSP